MSAQAEDDYFALNPAPAGLAAHLHAAEAFIARHTQTQTGPPVALVTSGGTTVPLENQTVRFIDNFSAGTRGAASAEYLLHNGYAVIFLHREFSLLPFARHYSHSRNLFLDLLTEDDGSATKEDQQPAITIRDEYAHDMRRVLREYNACKREGTLLKIAFTTITEYLWLLRELAKRMQPLGARGLFYLAAAVSDFFVPATRMVEHKIQSGAEFEATSGGTDTVGPDSAARMLNSRLVIDLDPVPKFLRSLVDSWAPQGMIISFKLETDPALLTSKAAGALRKYSHHLVIGNLLKTRKWEVVFVCNAVETGLQGGVRSDADPLVGEKWIRVPRLQRMPSAAGASHLVGQAEHPREAQPEETGVGVPEDEDGEPAIEIESLIIPEIKKLHTHFMARRKTTAATAPAS